MNALMLTPHLDHVGGTERQCLLLARALGQQGVRTRIVTRFSDRAQVSCDVRVERLAAPRIVRLKNRLLRASPMVGPAAPNGRTGHWTAARRAQTWCESRQIREYVCASDESILHLHGTFWPPMLIGVAAAARRTGRPLVVKIANEAERCWRILEHVPGALEALASARVIVTLSHAMRDFFVQRRLGPRIELIPNGVESAERLPLPTQRRLLFAGRLTFQKGVDVLLAALSDVPDAELDVVGDGEERAALEQRARTLGVSARVRFHGEGDVVPFMRRARVLVLPSRWEGMPNVLLEGLAWGRACVATNVTGSEDLISDGVNGLLVPPDDQRALAAALRRAVGEAGLGERLGDAGRARIASEYTLARVAARYRDLYSEL